MNYELIAKWEDFQKQADYFKKLELEYRNRILKEVFSYDENKCDSATVSVDLENNFKLKAVLKTSRKIDKDKCLEVCAFISEMENGKLIIERLLKWEPTLSISEYKKMPENMKKLFDECLTEKAAQGSLEIYESKI
jgi:hypothetical protein